MNNALLLATLDSLQTPHHLARAIVTAATAAQKRLCIVLFARFFNNDKDGISHTGAWDDVQRLLTYVYVQATKVAQDKDNILFNIDVLLKGLDDPIPDEIVQDVDVVYRVSGGSQDALPFAFFSNLIAF